MRRYILHRKFFATIILFIFTFIAIALVAQPNIIYVNGKIAFASNRDGHYEIYTMNLDGSQVTRLTYTNAYISSAEYPNWSPNGDYIAFKLFQYEANNVIDDIYVMLANGSELTNVTNSPENEQYPVWSPDGNQFAFTRSTDHGADIFIINVDGSGLTKVVDGADNTYNLYPTWSPDGRRIAYISTEGLLASGEYGGYFELKTVDLITGEQTVLGILDHYGKPDWSWSRNQITFYTNSTFYTAIGIINPDGTNRFLLSNETYPNQYPSYPRGDEDPVWSPDGSLITFDSSVYLDNDPNYYDRDIYVMNVDGTGVTNLTSGNTSEDIQPDWQPIIVQIPPTPTATFTSTITPSPTLTPTATPLPAAAPSLYKWRTRSTGQP